MNDYKKFIEEFEAYMETPQAQIDIDNMMERIREEEIASRTERNIPLEFTHDQEYALEVLRDLYDEQVDEVLTFFQKERAEKIELTTNTTQVLEILLVQFLLSFVIE